MNDSELLRRYAETGCETAFTDLVKRYVDLVYSAALRQVAGDTHLAQDVTQTVFIDLARKGASICERTVLSGWLYTSTRYAAAKTIRAEQRRQARDQEAYTMQKISGQIPPEPQWEQLRPLLDEAMHELNQSERDAVLLRYFEGRQLAEVGARLGLSEDAARMKVTRALDRLHGLLTKRGVSSTATALAVLLTSQSVLAAPAGLAANIVGATLLSAASGVSTSVTILKLMTMTKLKLGVLSALVVAGLATSLVVQHQTHVNLAQENHSLQQQYEQLTQQIGPLAAENIRLSNMIARANTSLSERNEGSNELLKLRAEVSRLRQEARESAQSKNTDSGALDDPAMQAALKTWATRVTQLKQRLEQMPDKKIPELQLVADKDWFDAVKGVKQLETDDDFRQALSDLRKNVKSEFARLLQQALRSYGQANGGQLPTELSQLKPYFLRPVDDAVLSRYSLLQTGKISDVSQGQFVVAETARAVDEEYDTIYRIGISGVNTSSISRVEEAVRQAGIQFAQANNGLLPTEPSQLAPYFKEPLDPARVQKVLSKVPPGITTLEQLNAVK
jgi:RNA polymerase sigma factor (sigma-70 family)